MSEQYFNKIREASCILNNMNDTKIECNVNAKINGMLYTSIPYYKGFKVYVDEKKVEPAIIGNALLGVKLSKGEHKIKITYFPYGLYIGGIISLCGVMGMIILIRRGRTENKF